MEKKDLILNAMYLKGWCTMNDIPNNLWWAQLTWTHKIMTTTTKIKMKDLKLGQPTSIDVICD